MPNFVIINCSRYFIVEERIYIYIYMPSTDSTPPRKDTGVFESFGRFIIGLKCHNYALYLCFVYVYIYTYMMYFLIMPIEIESGEVFCIKKLNTYFCHL